MKKPNILGEWRQAVDAIVPGDAREAAERATILTLMEREGEALLYRDCAWAHLTASSIILNADGSRTLMAYHRIYHSWAWTGGHADGDASPEMTARREAQEETGIGSLALIGTRAASVEILPVWAHERRGCAVGSHLHLNISYLFRADESQALRVSPEENTRVAWLPVSELRQYVSEPDMIPIYQRLIDRANNP